MPKIEVLSEEPLSMAEMKDELGKIKKRDEELNFRSEKTHEHLKEFIKLKAKDFKELKGKLEKLDIPRVKTNHINKLIDTLPRTVEELKVIMSGYTLTISADNMKKIVGVTSEYVKEDKKK